ncbi:hypothetical protein FNV43_RR17458 [Rhamnella rubrinervis]|uniref:K Homology domain-containing protein n=1 Tax=Rhamnella rubrinervis TaxID=2594499 RepID=A0A8K0GVR0_9ROSA|nr:hypothetical protein FNV43_RR17458 [Rhamnella rubrinervis]
MEDNPSSPVVFRLLCYARAIGGVIGNNGAAFLQLQRGTAARIHCNDPVPGFDDGFVVVVGSSFPDRRVVLTECQEGEEEFYVSSAQAAMLRVSERIWKLESHDGLGKAAMGEASCRLLGHRSQLHALIGNGGTNISRLREESGAVINIAPSLNSSAMPYEVIQIMGTVLAVKKALIAVSSCLQDHPPPDSCLKLSSKAKDIISNGASPSSMLPKFFLNLGSLLPPLSSEQSVNNSSQECSLTDTNGIPSKDMKGKRQKTLTGASIKFAVSVTPDFSERLVTISAFEASTKGTTVTAKLLIATEVVESLGGTEGEVVSEVREVTDAEMQILAGEQFLDYGPENSLIRAGYSILFITGDYESVQNALIQVTSSLRDHLLSREVRNRVRARSLNMRERKISSSELYQSSGLCPDSNEETFLTSQRNQLGLFHSTGTLPRRLWLPQGVERGPAKNFGGDEGLSGTELATVTNTMLEMAVSQHVFGSVCGEDGRNLDSIRKISGAKVEVHDPCPGRNEGKVVISGTPDQTMAAQSLLQAFIQPGQMTQKTGR